DWTGPASPLVAAAGEVTGNYPGIFENIESDATIVIRDITLDSEDNLYVLTTFDSAIYKFNKEGVFVDRIGQEGDAPGDFTSPLALAVDGQGRIWVDDFTDILVFDGNGRYLNTIPMDGTGFTLLFGTANNLYRMNRNDNRIEKYALLK
ncbi:MAG: 6-bladed beta-propeller, partial [Anaerolineae bacterium]